LCWLTVEQQFIPALAIASAVSNKHKITMFILLVVHYSILKRLYRKRHKNLRFSVDGLAFLCILSLAIFIWTLFIDPVTIWNHSGNRNPIKSRIDILAIIGVLLIMSFLVDKFLKVKFQELRRVIFLTRRIKRYISFIYLSIYLSLFIISFLIVINAKP